MYCFRKCLNLLPAIGGDEDEGSEAFEVCVLLECLFVCHFIPCLALKQCGSCSVMPPVEHCGSHEPCHQ